MFDQYQADALALLLPAEFVAHGIDKDGPRAYETTLAVVFTFAQSHGLELDPYGDGDEMQCSIRHGEKFLATVFYHCDRGFSVKVL